METTIMGLYRESLKDSGSVQDLGLARQQT